MDVVGSGALAGTPVFTETFERVLGHVHSLGYTYAQSKQVAGALIMKKMSQAAVVMSFQDAFIVAGFIVLVALIPSLFLPGRGNAKKGQKPPAMME